MENGFFSTPGMMPWIKADCRSCSKSALPWRPDAIAKGIARFESPDFTRNRAPATAGCSFLKSFDVIELARFGPGHTNAPNGREGDLQRLPGKSRFPHHSTHSL